MLTFVVSEHVSDVCPCRTPVLDLFRPVLKLNDELPHVGRELHREHFAPGHSIETLWMVMHEAIRVRNGTTFYICKSRIRRILEMGWDYVFEGLAGSGYNVFGSEDTCAGGMFDVKSMWVHTEVLIASMLILEYTGDVWALEWYERARKFTLRTMPTGFGVWRQAVDRLAEYRS